MSSWEGFDGTHRPVYFVKISFFFDVLVRTLNGVTGVCFHVCETK